MSESKKPESVLRELFGDNRAEWPPERFRDLFIAPAYFTKLETRRPSLLVGGRGTGKTTALRSLRYDATFERLEAGGLGLDDQEYFGIYVRINKNRVTAFGGTGLSDSEWQKAFAHYFNLLGALEFAKLTTWLEQQRGTKISIEDLSAIASDLAIPAEVDSEKLQTAIKHHLSCLQLFVNNPRSAERPTMSMSDAPLTTFAQVLQNRDLAGQATLFCCIDEYENLSENQQATLNTYIKHAEPPLSYKIGVRHSGLRTHNTTDGSDLLQAPDDYNEISIVDEGFELFAPAVANLRLRRASERGLNVPTTLSNFLEELDQESEARKLGAEVVAARVKASLGESKDEDVKAWAASATMFQLHFLAYWAQRDQSKALHELAQDWRLNEKAWKNRLNNYGYASLFWLSKGRKGARIRKYYSGERTIIGLAGGNIRYFLELLDESIGNQLAGDDDGFQQKFVVSAQAQTEAARKVGQRRLGQLEGLAGNGVELKRLVLGIGKVFFELARDPVGHTPEVSCFVLTGSEAARQQIETLLLEGVAHLAFLATPKTKATPLEMRDNEYRLHPIFCPFFEFSHRRKRRTTFKAEALLALSDKPSSAIAELMDGGLQSSEGDLPEQLAFFSAFYGEKD